MHEICLSAYHLYRGRLGKQQVDVELNTKSPVIRILNAGNVQCFWNPQSWALESEI